MAKSKETSSVSADTGAALTVSDAKSKKNREKAKRDKAEKASNDAKAAKDASTKTKSTRVFVDGAHGNKESQNSLLPDVKKATVGALSSTNSKAKLGTKYSEKLSNFICEKIEDGLTLSEVCRIHSDMVPSRRQILNLQKEHPEFKESMDFAYYCFIQTKIDELEYVSTASLAELFPGLEYKEASEARRARLDTLKFLTAKLAPALSSRWDKAKTVKHEGIPENSGGPQITIVSYAAAPAIEQHRVIDVDSEDD